MKPKHRIFRSLPSQNLLVQNSNGNARKISKICTNLRIKCSEIWTNFTLCSGFTTVEFEQVNSFLVDKFKFDPLFHINVDSTGTPHSK